MVCVGRCPIRDNFSFSSSLSNPCLAFFFFLFVLFDWLIDAKSLSKWQRPLILAWLVGGVGRHYFFILQDEKTERERHFFLSLCHSVSWLNDDEGNQITSGWVGAYELFQGFSTYVCVHSFGLFLFFFCFFFLLIHIPSCLLCSYCPLFYATVSWLSQPCSLFQ